MKLSLAIATFNEEKNIITALASVQGWVDEIIIVDGGSSDKTVEIAKQYDAQIIITNNPPIFHINKQKALDKCKGEWILQLDADEVVTPELKAEILHVINSTTYNGYYVPRKNFFLDHWLRKGGQYPDYVIRLFQRGKGKFPSKSVHEQISINGTVGYLNNALLHYSSKNSHEYWRKGNTYINLSVQELKTRHIPINIITYFQYMLYKPLKTFLILFIRHKGFIDGFYGLLFALFSALHYPIAYWRYMRLK